MDEHEGTLTIRSIDMDTTNIVVIILTYNQRQKTLKCLSTLLGGEDIPFKVLLWDNNSRDDTIAAINETFPDVSTYYSKSNLGVAEGRNASGTMAIGELGATHL